MYSVDLFRQFLIIESVLECNNSFLNVSLINLNRLLSSHSPILLSSSILFFRRMEYRDSDVLFIYKIDIFSYYVDFAMLDAFYNFPFGLGRGCSQIRSVCSDLIHVLTIRTNAHQTILGLRFWGSIKLASELEHRICTISFPSPERRYA